MTDEPKGPVAAELARTRHLPYESARMLAILPRVKYYNESTAAAFAGSRASKRRKCRPSRLATQSVRVGNFRDNSTFDFFRFSGLAGCVADVFS